MPGTGPSSGSKLAISSAGAPWKITSNLAYRAAAGVVNGTWSETNYGLSGHVTGNGPVFFAQAARLAGVSLVALLLVLGGVFVTQYLWASQDRELSAQFGLPTAEKPQLACLSSRIPYGEAVNPEKLRIWRTAGQS